MFHRKIGRAWNLDFIARPHKIKRKMQAQENRMDTLRAQASIAGPAATQPLPATD
jgi:hypothetical protein